MTPGDAKHILFGTDTIPKVRKSTGDVAEIMAVEDFCDDWANAGHVASAREPMNDGRHPLLLYGATPLQKSSSMECVYVAWHWRKDCQ